MMHQIEKIEGQIINKISSFTIPHNNDRDSNLLQFKTDEVVSFMINKLHHGLKVSKVGRRGTKHDIKLFLTPDNRSIRWNSRLVGLKFGKEKPALISSNEGKLTKWFLVVIAKTDSDLINISFKIILKATTTRAPGIILAILVFF
jgi:hypothetical protein